MKIRKKAAKVRQFHTVNIAYGASERGERTTENDVNSPSALIVLI